MYSKILVPIDGSETADCALVQAAQLARLGNATLILLHIIEETRHTHGFEPPEVYIHEVRPHFLASGQRLLDDTANRLRSEGLDVKTVLLESGGKRISDLIKEQTELLGCDLIVLGTHGRRGIDRLLLGSDAEQTARIAPVPIMLVRLTKAAPTE